MIVQIEAVPVNGSRPLDDSDLDEGTVEEMGEQLIPRHERRCHRPRAMHDPNREVGIGTEDED